MSRLIEVLIPVFKGKKLNKYRIYPKYSDEQARENIVNTPISDSAESRTDQDLHSFPHIKQF